MESKYIIFMVGSIVAVPMAVLWATVSRRFREAMFFAIIAGTVLKGKLDLNFVSREFYRGSSRGFEFSFVDLLGIVLLVSSLLTLPKSRHRRFWPPSYTLMTLYFLWCCLSVMLADPKLFACFELLKVLKAMMLFMTIFIFVRGERELTILISALCASVIYAFLVSAVQRYVYGEWRLSGPLSHPCEFSLYMNVITPVLLAASVSELHKFIRRICMLCVGLAGMCVLFTVSRTGIATYAIICPTVLVLCLRKRLLSTKHMMIGAVIILVCCGVLAKAWDTISARFGAHSLSQEFADEDFDGRGRYFRMAAQIVPDSPIVGLGLNNWSYITTRDYPASSRKYPPQPYNGTSALPPTIVNQEPPAHNMIILTLGELGVVGLLLFCAVWGRWIQMSASFLRERSADLVSRFGIGVLCTQGAIFLEGLTSPSYRDIPTFYVSHMIFGALASMYCRTRWASRKDMSANKWGTCT
ncbi:O-antigen ligase family protein [Candidatus Hydrogenedentota bacterium]